MCSIAVIYYKCVSRGNKKETIRIDRVRSTKYDEIRRKLERNYKRIKRMSVNGMKKDHSSFHTRYEH